MWVFLNWSWFFGLCIGICSAQSLRLAIWDDHWIEVENRRCWRALFNNRSPTKAWESRRWEAGMDSFSSSSGSPPNTEALMDQIKAQLAQAYAQEFLETVGNKCFAKCVTKPGSSLSGSESSCISRCVDRYIEATGIVSRALFSSTRWATMCSLQLLLKSELGKNVFPRLVIFAFLICEKESNLYIN